MKKDEIIWNREGVNIFKEKYGHNPNNKPIIIKRDPIKRIWSSYWYFQLDPALPPFREQYTFEEYLHIDMYEHHLGELNPIKCSNYDKWIKVWEPLKPIIYTFEDLIKEKDFPHLNKTEDEIKQKVPKMTQEQYDLTKKLLDKEIG